MDVYLEMQVPTRPGLHMRSQTEFVSEKFPVQGEEISRAQEDLNG